MTVTADNIAKQISLVILAKKKLNIDIDTTCFICKRCVKYMCENWRSDVSSLALYTNITVNDVH